MAEVHELSAIALVRALASGELSPREAVAHFLGRIARHDPALGAFVEVTGERALARAEALGAPDPVLPLWGLPLADKDLTAREGVPTRYGSRVFAEYVPTHSDPLARALDRLGAVSLGKTNTPEFGLTGYTESLVAPPARNPWDPTTGAGGSSGGAAVAVAAGLLPIAVGDDGGGSVRIPAATVGVVGLKPSRGRLPIGSGLDAPGGLVVTGPIARSVADAAFLLDALVQAAPYQHATTAPGQGPFLDAAGRDPGKLRIGATTVTPWDGWTDTALDPSSRAAYDAAVAALAGEGHDVSDPGWLPRGYPELFTTLWRASAALVPVADDRLDEVEPLTAWLVREGRALGAADAIAAYRAAAAFERETIAAFAPFDAILLPSLALTPRSIGWFGTDPSQNFARQCSYAPHTSFANVAGLPAITVPFLPDAAGRPVGVQLVGRPGGEATILALGAQLERRRGRLPAPPVPPAP